MIVSSLSSALPLSFPLLSNLSFMTSSLTSIMSTNCRFALSPICLFHSSIFSWFLGNPSIKNFFFSHPLSFIALCSSWTRRSLETNFPELITELSLSASSPPFLTSSLSKSPVERCAYPKFLTILSHWVPFPLPGPPRTKTTFGFPEGVAASAALALPQPY